MHTDHAYKKLISKGADRDRRSPLGGRFGRGPLHGNRLWNTCDDAGSVSFVAGWRTAAIAQTRAGRAERGRGAVAGTGTWR
jgi:hypothetical protein